MLWPGNSKRHTPTKSGCPTQAKPGCPTLAASLSSGVPNDRSSSLGWLRLGWDERARPHRSKSPGLMLPLAALICLLPLAGCGRAPSFNILGSFFPAWLICMVVGIVLAAIVNWALTTLKLEKLIAWGILVYPCLAAFFAFTLWLLFFS